MGRTIRMVSHRFQHFGDDKVSTAAALIAKLPNGWKLKTLEYRRDLGSWIAVVEGPQEDVES